MRKIRSVSFEKRASVRYAFIFESLPAPDFSVLRIEDFCRVLDVSRSGFYAWKARQGKSQPCRLLVSDKSIIREMKAFRKKHRFTPGV